MALNDNFLKFTVKVWKESHQTNNTLGQEQGCERIGGVLPFILFSTSHILSYFSIIF